MEKDLKKIYKYYNYLMIMMLVVAYAVVAYRSGCLQFSGSSITPHCVPQRGVIDHFFSVGVLKKKSRWKNFASHLTLHIACQTLTQAHKSTSSSAAASFWWRIVCGTAFSQLVSNTFHSLSKLDPWGPSFCSLFSSLASDKTGRRVRRV